MVKWKVKCEFGFVLSRNFQHKGAEIVKASQSLSCKIWALSKNKSGLKVADSLNLHAS